MRRPILVFLSACVVILLVFFLAGPLSAPPAQAEEGRIIILSAFGGCNDAGVCSGEAGPFLKELSLKHEVPFGRYCQQGVYEGRLYGRSVTIVSAGVGKVQDTACAMALLSYYRGQGRIRAVIGGGIAGQPPRLGDKLNGEPLAIGDVGIFDVLVDWDIRHYSSIGDFLMGLSAWWPGSVKPTTFVSGSYALAQQVYEAGQRVQFAPLEGGPRDNTIKYNGENTRLTPKVWGPDQGASITGDQFWHGKLETRQALLDSAEALSKIRGQLVSPDDIMFETQMEDNGWGFVFASAGIPFVTVRSGSNMSEPWASDVPAAVSIKTGMGQGGSKIAALTRADVIKEWVKGLPY